MRLRLREESPVAVRVTDVLHEKASRNDKNMKWDITVLLTWNIDLCGFAGVFSSFENEYGLVSLRKSCSQRKARRTGADDDVVILSNSHVEGDRICELKLRETASVAYRSSTF